MFIAMLRLYILVIKQCATNLLDYKGRNLEAVKIISQLHYQLCFAFLNNIIQVTTLWENYLEELCTTASM